MDWENEEDDFDDEDENYEAFSVDELAEILKQEEGLEVEVVEKKKGVKTIHVHCADPSETRKKLRFEVGPDIGVEFIQPRKTKATGFMLQAIQDGTDEMINVKIMKGGTHRAGRQNELAFQNFIQSEIKNNGVCHLDISDNQGKRVVLDIVEVIDTAQIHGKDGKVCRTDTTVKLTDGSTYGISHKKTNATFVCKVKKMFHQILAGCARILRQYARENGLVQGDYMDVRITNKELLNLCWFGTDITNGAVFIGDFEGMSSGTQKIARIIEKGDEETIDNFPIYTKWKIKNSAFTLIFCGVTVASKEGKWIVDGVVVPGINAPLPNGKSYVTGNEPKKRKRRKKRRRTVKESSDEDGRRLFLERLDDMWDTIAWCAENHKMVWLKYETVDGETISRRVAPYSYRTRRTKVRGKATYFYGQDFTPGEDNSIKCFLVDNCLQAKKSPTSFSPKFTIEIKQEIDRLEDQRRKEEREKEREERKMKTRHQNREKEQDAKQKTKDDMENYKNTPKKPEPNKPETSQQKQEPQKKDGKEDEKKPIVTDVQQGKTDVKQENPDAEPKKPLPPPKEKNDQKKNGENGENAANGAGEKEDPETQNMDDKTKVSVTDQPDDTGANKPKDENEVQVTDQDGNVVNESGEDNESLHGMCHQWAWDNWQDGDKFFVLTEYDDEIEGNALLHCGLFRDGTFIDAEVQSDNIDDILENFDYGDPELEVLSKEEFKDFCIDFGLPLR